MHPPRRTFIAAGMATLATGCASTVGRTGPSGTLLQEALVPHDAGTVHVQVHGRAADLPCIAILPSLGRGVEDYTERYDCSLTTRLVAAGYRVVAVQPRGVGLSRGELTPGQVSMADLAGDVLAALDALHIDRLHLAGHAFGNRLARYIATEHPQRVDRLALLAAGGDFQPPEDARKTLAGSFNLSLPDATRLDMLRQAFFAPGHDPSSWLDGWYPRLARAQLAATRASDRARYKAAGGKPFLLLQPMEDVLAPPEQAGRALKAQLQEQVRYVEIPRAGHALSSEQPALIAQHLLAYFGAGR